MLGLLYKDFLLLWKQYLFFFFAMAFAMMVGVTATVTNLFFVLFPVLYAAVLPPSLVSMEERERWTAFALTMPPSRRTMVTEKYLLGLLLCLIMGLLNMAFSLVFLALGEAVDLAARLQLTALGMAFGLGSMAVQFPLVYWLGAERAVIATSVVAGVVCGGSAIFSFSGALRPQGLPVQPLLGVFLVVLPLLAGSWALSQWLFSRRSL